MTKVAELFVKIGAKIDDFEKGMNDVQRAMTKVGNKMTSMGKNLSLKVTAPILAMGAASVKAFADFDQAMTESLAIMGNVSDAMKKDMAEAARTMSEQTTFSATELAEAYYFLASAGLNAEQSISALSVVAKFAQAGMFNLSSATDLLTDAQSALGLTVKDVAKNEENMARVSDVLVKANTLANASVFQFSEALTNRAGPALRMVGKDVEEGVAVLAAFADQGRKGSEAGEAFAIVLRDLQRAALKKAGAFKQANIAVFDASGEMRNLGEIISEVERHMDGMSDAQKKATLTTLGFQERSQANLLTLIGTSEKIKEYEKELRKAAGTTQEVSDKQLESLSAKLKMARNRLVNVAKDIGKQLAPALMSLIKFLEKGVRWFANMDETSKKLILVIGGLAAAMGPLLLVMGQVLKASALLQAANINLVSSFGKLTIAIGAAYGAYKILIKIREKWEKATGRYTDDVTKAWGKLYNKIGGMTTLLNKLRPILLNYNVGWKKQGEILGGLNQLWHKYKQNTVETLKAIARGEGGKLAKKALMDLTNNHHLLVEEAKKAEEAIESEEESFENLWETLKGKLNPALAKVSEIIEERLLPPARDLTHTFYRMTDNVAPWVKWMTKAKGEVGAVAKGMAKLTVEVKEQTDAWKNMTDDIAKSFGDTFAKILSKAKSFTEALDGLIQSLLNIFTNMLGKMVSTAMTSFNDLKENWNDLWKGLFTSFAVYVSTNLVKSLLTAVGILKEKVTPEIQAILDKLKEAVKAGKELVSVIKKASLTLGSGGTEGNRAGENPWRGLDFEEVLNKGTLALVKLIRKMREAGKVLPEVSEYIRSQLMKIPDALQVLIDNVNLTNSKFQIMGMDTGYAIDKMQGKLDGLAQIVSTTFQAMTAEGMSYMDALNQLREPLEALRAKYEEIGREVPDYLKPLMDLSEKMELRPAVFQNLEAARTILQSLANTSYLTQDSFNALVKSVNQFARVTLGATGNLNKMMEKMELSQEQINQLLPVVAQFVGAAAIFGLSIPKWMKTFVTEQLGVEWKEFRRTMKQQQNAGVVTVEKLQRLIDLGKNQDGRTQNNLLKIRNAVRTWLEKVRDEIRQLGRTLEGLSSPTGDVFTRSTALNYSPHDVANTSILRQGQPTSVVNSGATIHITYAPQISAIDAQGVRDFIEGPGREALVNAIEGNVGGMTRRIKTATENF